MDTLYTEVNEYLKIFLSNDKMDKKSIIPTITNYGDYIQGLMPPALPTTLYKYINIPLMIHDLHEEGKILVFCFSPSEDNDTIYSDIDYDQAEHTQGFINGVKLLDDSDIREQITANNYTGGFWDERIHWVVDLKALEEKTNL